MPRDQLQRLGVEIGTAFTRKSLLGASPAVFRDLKVQDRATTASIAEAAASVAKLPRGVLPIAISCR